MIRSRNLILLLLLSGCAPSGHHLHQHAGSVDIFLRHPDAEEVYFASSLDGYQLHPARNTADSQWEIKDLDNREFRYFYLVDGSVYLPDCSYREKDDFGAANCVYQPQAGDETPRI